LFRSVPTSSLPDVASLLLPTWNPGQVNGTSTRSWGKTGDSNHVAPDPSVCWDSDGKMVPVGLVEMTEEEKALYTADVNSPLKIPQQNKDGSQSTAVQNGRKASISHGTGNYGVGASPSTASRPGTKRRETTDTNPFPNSAIASPSASRFADSSWFGRKTAEQLKEATTYDEPEEDNTDTRDQAIKPNPFAALTRSNTTGTPGFGAAASLWGTTPAPAPVPATSGIGAFGSFALTSPAATEKRFDGTRGGSRLAHLMPKESTESVGSKPGDSANADGSRAWRARPRTDTDPFGADDGASGSAALGGAHDASPPSVPSQLQGGGIFDTPVKGNTGDFGMSGLNLGGGHDGHGHGPASPSETNPYRSPLAERGGDGEHHDDTAHERAHQFGHGSEPHSNFSTISRAFGGGPFVEGSDRSQTSSVGAKGYPSLNTLTGWPAGPTTGTPDRERAGFASAFGSSLFSPVGDMHSPSLGGLGGMFSSGPSASSVGATGSLRGSKLGSLFPPAMQAQMQNHEQDPLGDSIPDLRQGNPLGAIGRGPVGVQTREADSPMRSGRGVFEDLFPSADAARLAFSSADQGQPGLTATAGQAFTPTSSIAPPFPSSQAAADLTAAQNRQMVMPDRMRWVYLDPQGQVQGPFNGLEMNDWYKAQFFSPDLRVKKIEDADFEPLGQLIRRIGNSREPFLVPQIGIPHGPPSQTGPFSPGDRGVIPPLMGAFPSFGRTLTAEEQNNLERRKQEEQILMARQREYLAHSQAFSKIQMPGAPSSLHHHSSAHSLQSQPSFGSISSPHGLPPQPPIGALGPTPGFFDSSANLLQQTPGAGLGNGSDMFPPDLTAQERQMLASLQPSSGLSGGFPSQPTQPIGAHIGDSGLRSQLPGVDQLQNDSQGFSARLKEFNEIRNQREAEETSKATGLPDVAEENAEHEHAAGPSQAAVEHEVTRPTQAQEGKKTATMHAQQQLSLTQQVQKTQAAAAAAAAANAVAAATAKQAENEEAWAKASASGLPMPFPPPSSTPLPAPTAQRQRSTLPTQFTGPSPTGTPDTLAEVAPPPLAPWASQAEAAHKGPSLKEIQEAEAKKAAKAEEAAAAARRALLEQEAAALREREKAAAIATGLPSSSTWGTVSPANTPSVSSPWAKPAVVKGAVPVVAATVTAGSERKKTLAEIQREEEARKQKAKESALQQGATPAASLGKRYADLASKTSAAPPGIPGGLGPAVVAAVGTTPVTAGGWATVGAGGKVKAPTGPSSQVRTASTSVKPTPTPAAKTVVKPSAAPSSRDTGSDAMQEFHKWVHRELSRGLSGIQDSKFSCHPSF
jgi:PERQ amino acid-rich with GYF domain-containing protein